MDELGDGSHDDSKHVGVDGTGEAGGERKRSEISWRLKEAEGEEKMRELTGSKPPSTSDGSVAGTSSGRTLVPGTAIKKLGLVKASRREVERATNLQVISLGSLVIAEVLLDLRVRLQLLSEDIVLVEEEDDARLGEPLGVADLCYGAGGRARESQRSELSSEFASSRRRDEPNRRA